MIASAGSLAQLALHHAREARLEPGDLASVRLAAVAVAAAGEPLLLGDEPPDPIQ